MKIVQSYWSKPYEKSNVGDRMGGWCNKMFHYMSCAFSCLKLAERYPVEFVTDRRGRDIFVDKIGLPFQAVKDDLENIEYPTDLWAVAKIITYALQTEPFLHVDNDVFIWSEFPESIEKSNLAVQSIEENYAHNSLYAEDIIRKFDYVPEVILEQKKNRTVINSINAGIIGGNHLPFIHDYAREAIRFIERNLNKLDALDNLKGFNLIFEQCLFYQMARQQGEDIACLLNEKMNLEYKELVRFWDAPRFRGYIHAISTYKEHYVIGEQMAQRLWYEYPDYFYRIQQLIKANAI